MEKKVFALEAKNTIENYIDTISILASIAIVYGFINHAFEKGYGIAGFTVSMILAALVVMGQRIIFKKYPDKASCLMLVVFFVPIVGTFLCWKVFEAVLDDKPSVSTSTTSGTNRRKNRSSSLNEFEFL